MTERLGDQASRQVLHEHHRIVRDALARHGGREINVQGDGFMVAFGGVARALRCAVDIQRAFSAYVPGEATRADRRPYRHPHRGRGGRGRRLPRATPSLWPAGWPTPPGPGEILVSSLSEQLVQGSGEFAFDGHGETQLKGMTRPQPSATLSWAQ